MILASRYHDISCGHRVYGHENKCAHVHGHNYRITFHCEAEHLDNLGRVADFGVIKSLLCMWVEQHWDHKTLLWQEDPLAARLEEIDPGAVYIVGFNPTAENMAKWLVTELGPMQFANTRGVRLVECTVEETRKCSATFKL